MNCELQIKFMILTWTWFSDIHCLLNVSTFLHRNHFLKKKKKYFLVLRFDIIIIYHILIYGYQNNNILRIGCLCPTQIRVAIGLQGQLKFPNVKQTSQEVQLYSFVFSFQIKEKCYSQKFVNSTYVNEKTSKLHKDPGKDG